MDESFSLLSRHGMVVKLVEVNGNGTPPEEARHSFQLSFNFLSVSPTWHEKIFRQSNFRGSSASAQVNFQQFKKLGRLSRRQF